MLLVSIYLAAAIVGYAEVAEFLISFHRDIKKEGYKYTKKDKKGNKPGILTFFKENKDYAIFPIIPIINFPYVFFLFSKKELNLHKLKSMYIKDEKIYIPKKEKEENKKEEEKTISKNKEIPTPQVIVGEKRVLKKSLKKDSNRFGG